MTHGLYREILDQVFAALNLSEDERQETTLWFKKKLANNLWGKLESEFSGEERNWVASHPDATADEPEVKAMQEKILQKHTQEEVLAASHDLFKTALGDYIVSNSEGLDEPDKARLQEILSRV